MAIKTRQTTATGVTNNNAPLTNAELDNNFVELQQNKADLSGATFTGAIDVTGEVKADKFTNDEALPDVRPSLLLDFANKKELGESVTFSRGSTATYWDGKTTAKSEENLVTRSEEFNFWSVTNVSITANDTTAPDGTTTADRMTADGTSGFHWVGISSGTGHTMSVYAKAGTNDLIQILVGNSGTPFANFDLTNGTFTGFGANCSGSSIASVGNGWYRCTLHSTDELYNMYVAIISTDSASRAETNTESGYVYLWGAQVENRDTSTTSPTAYTKTFTSYVVKYQPVLQTALANEPRFDHDPVTGECKGLLIERARTNLEDYSEFMNGWGSNGISFYRPYAISPDGTRSAAMMLITSQETVQGAYASNPYSVTLGTYYTASMFVRKETNSALAVDFTFYFRNSIGSGSIYGSISMNSETGFDSFSQNVATTATYKVEDLGSWWRISVTSNEIPTGNIRANIRMNNQAVGKRLVVWGFQVEDGSYPTSYIPTNGATVTRSIDGASVSGAAFTDAWNDDEMTVYASGTANTDRTSNTNLLTITSTESNVNNRAGWSFRTNTGSNEFLVDNFYQYGGAPANYANNAYPTARVAYRFKNQDFAWAVNYPDNDLFTSNALTGYGPAKNKLYIGATYNGSANSTTVAKIAFYPAGLSNATLQAMTEE